MASEYQVKEYLAYWFQLGKKIAIENGKEIMLPKPIFTGDRYSQEFEECWQKIMIVKGQNCYLEDTEETIANLLSEEWVIDPCARCLMPIPLRTHGMPALCCPCYDIPTWPNTELPLPRGGINSRDHLISIRDRLLETMEKEAKEADINNSNSNKNGNSTNNKECHVIYMKKCEKSEQNPKNSENCKFKLLFMLTPETDVEELQK